MNHEEEIKNSERCQFGKNWARFLELLNEERIGAAEASLRTMLVVDSLEGMRFLDVGSGSGLFSLAARRLGAKVHSFDYDPQSVECTEELRRCYFPEDSEWQIDEASVLDEEYLKGLGKFDVVYSWGVLHHTGAMWQALANIAQLVESGGKLFVAIYNDQGRPSRQWLKVKRAYCKLPNMLRWIVLWPAFLRLWGPTTVRDFCRLRPFKTWRDYTADGVRGMNPWRDVVDWVGGYPFEVAKPEDIFYFYRQRGYQLDRLETCAGGHGCNEYILIREG